jgi:hypothetical protein
MLVQCCPRKEVRPRGMWRCCKNQLSADDVFSVREPDDDVVTCRCKLFLTYSSSAKYYFHSCGFKKFQCCGFEFCGQRLCTEQLVAGMHQYDMLGGEAELQICCPFYSHCSFPPEERSAYVLSLVWMERTPSYDHYLSRVLQESNMPISIFQIILLP